MIEKIVLKNRKKTSLTIKMTIIMIIIMIMIIK